ncbi:MAG TPA: DUF445 domain-containing protein, partial [Mycobacteriales bacterium]|nr:DUF445 domain-containing protein [Mycobacteriales bacterium]
WVGYVQATAEAAMVGALADWFAVTALFRHPLHLPIPHTAILPRKKDQLGASLGEFVQTNFLSAPVIAEKLRTLGVGRRLGVWLADPKHARRIGDTAGAAIGGATEIMRDDDVQAGFEQVLLARLRDTPKAPFLGRVVDLAVEAGHDQRLLVAGVAVLRTFLDENKQVLRERFGAESPVWVPNRVDDAVFARAYSGLQHFLEEVAADPDHPLRKDATNRFRELAHQLREDPEMEVRVTALAGQVLDSNAVRGLAATLWSTAKRNLITMSADPDSELRARLEATIVGLGERLRDDPALQAKVERWLDDAVGYVVDTYRAEIADLVTGTVARWDADEASRRIELQVGRDLQFIRVNGTVVGGLAGLIIYTIAQLIG